MTAVTVSIIVSAFNKVEYLHDCLTSIQSQTNKEWECIVVDDCSPKGDIIFRIVDGMCDKRFRIIRHSENRGPAAARNTGAREARGQYLLFVDEDDKLAFDNLDKQLRILQKTDPDIVVTGARYFGDRDGAYPTKVATLAEMAAQQSLIGCGFLMKRKVWEELGGWDEHAALAHGREDHDWWIRVLKKDYKIDLVDEALYFYRVDESYVASFSTQHRAATLNEVRIRKYILSKHKDVYSKMPAVKKAVLLNACRSEAKALVLVRNLPKASLRYFQAFRLSGEMKDLWRAIDAIAGAVGATWLMECARTARRTMLSGR